MRHGEPVADLAARLNQTRKRRGIAVGELARDLDVSRATMSDILSGKLSPSPSVARRLIECLTPDETTAEELRALAGSRYMSSGLDGPVDLGSG